MTELKGFHEVMYNLNREIAKVKDQSMKGLIRAQIVIRRDMETTPPMTPVDTGNLRASYFAVTSKGANPVRGGNFKGEEASKLVDDHSRIVSTVSSEIKGGSPTIALGYTAYYATYVHEMVGANFKRPGSGAKFFEAAIKRNVNKIVEIIRDEAKIK